MTPRFLVPLLLTLAAPLHADPVADILAEARDFCTGFENGLFDAGEAVIEVDLDGVAPPDRLVDLRRVRCSSMASMYCGSGGCSLHAVIGEQSWRFQAEAWRMIDWGQPILLLARDGVWCGGMGAQLCFEAVSWSNGKMMSVMPQP